MIEPFRVTSSPGCARLAPAAGALGAAALFAVAGAATFVATLAIVFRLHVPLPVWDEWAVVADFRSLAAGTYSLGDLANQHNEHRLLFPRLFFFADELLFGLSGRFNLSMCFVLQLSTAVVLLRVLRRRVADAASRVMLAGFVVLLLFTLRQEQNLSIGFQLQFVGVFTAQALSALAYVGALGRLRDGRWRAVGGFALAGLACVVATYTMANGVLAGFVLGGAALLWGAPWRVPFATWALSALLAALFFHGYAPGSMNYPWAEVVPHLWAYPRFLTAYLGNPIGDDVRSTQALGVAGVLALSAATWRLAAARTRDAPGLALWALAAFVVATAAATTYGRIAGGTQQALETRYATPSSIFWCAMVLYWFPVVVWRGSPRAARLALAGLMSLLAVAAARSEATAWPDLASRSTALRRVADSMAAGLFDGTEAEPYENGTAEEVREGTAFLREHRLAAFADPAVAALGRPADALGGMAPADACAGDVAARSDPALGEGGVRLSGSAWDAARRAAPGRIVVADAAGTVLGFGSAAEPGHPRRSWTGYARAPADAVLTAYARLADGRICALGSARVAEPTPARPG